MIDSGEIKIRTEPCSCGCHPEVVYIWEMASTYYGYELKCPKCGRKTSPWQHLESAFSEWNKKTCKKDGLKR